MRIALSLETVPVMHSNCEVIINLLIGWDLKSNNNLLENTLYN